MFRSLSTGNRTCNQKVIDRNYALHQKRLKNIKSISSETLKLQNHDSEVIKTASYLRNHNKKKEVQNEEYYVRVERDNRILLEKMADIVNNKMRNTLSNFTPPPPQKTMFKTKSLNQIVRKKEIVRITSDNYGVLNRIQQQESAYDVKGWEKDFKTKEKYLQNICLFPVITRQPNSQKKSPRKVTTARLSNASPRSSVDHKNVNYYDSPKSSHLDNKLQPINTARRLSSGPLISVSGRKSSVQEPVMFTKEIFIDSKLYKVQFLKQLDEGLKIVVTDIQTSSSKYIVLSKDKAKQLLAENNENYEQISSRIYFRDDTPQIKDSDSLSEQRSSVKIELFDPNVQATDSIKAETQGTTEERLESPDPPQKLTEEKQPITVEAKAATQA